MGRALSSIEHLIWLVDQEVRQNFVIVCRVTGPLNRRVLREALDIVQEKFPPLKWKIKEGDTPEFVSRNVPPIPLRVVERKDEDHWIEEAEKEMDQTFAFTVGPLLRVVLLTPKNGNTCDLLVTFCHIASDATSGIMMVKHLLTYAGRLESGKTVEVGPVLPVPPSSLEALKKDLKFPSDPATPGHGESIVLKPDRDVPPEKRITRIIHRVWDPESTLQLVTRCRKEKTSVHGVICAAFLQSLVEHVRPEQENAADDPLTISCITAVDLRHHFSAHSEENIGYYISFAVHFQDIDDHALIWDEARKIKDTINTEVKYGRDIEAIKEVGDALKAFSKPIDIVRAVNSSNPPVAVTNLGRQNIPKQYDGLVLETLHFPVAIHFDTRSGLAIAVTTFHNRMTLNFLYAEPYLHKERAAGIVDATMKRLKDAIL